MKITMYELLGLVKDDKAPWKVKYQNEVLYYDYGDLVFYLFISIFTIIFDILLFLIQPIFYIVVKNLEKEDE